jgi:hypothetical protein
MLKFLYSRTQNVAVPLCPGPPLNSEIWIWSQVNSRGICGVRYVTWTGFSLSICVFPCHCHSSSAQWSFHLWSSTLYHIGSWYRCEVTLTQAKKRVFETSGMWRCFGWAVPDVLKDSGVFNFMGKTVQEFSQAPPWQPTFRILKGFNAKWSYPLGLSGLSDIDVELWGPLEYALTVHRKGEDWTEAKATSDCCEHCHVPLGSVNCGEFLDQLRNC